MSRRMRKPSSSKRRRACTSASSICAGRSAAGSVASARRRRRRRCWCRRSTPRRSRSAGDHADRAGGVRAAGCCPHYGLPRGARIRVHRALPTHVGLGSGTQLALAVARALTELHGVEADAQELARVVGRARRSAIGTWTFAGGGLVVEGGRRSGSDDSAPLLARLPFPPSWRCVVAVPDAPPVSAAPPRRRPWRSCRRRPRATWSASPTSC